MRSFIRTIQYQISLQHIYRDIQRMCCMGLLLWLTTVCTFSQSQEHSNNEPDISSIQSSSITLLFVGDLMQHQAQIEAAHKGEQYDYTSYFRYVKQEIENADLAIGNLEVTMGGKPYKGYPAFSAPDEYLYAIKEAGFDILTTANNHCLDRGYKGGIRTIRLLDSLDILHLGTYIDSTSRNENHPLIVNIKNFKLAFISYTYATNGIKAAPPFVVNYIDKTAIVKDLQEAKRHHPDAIIALMHWGEEYHSLPSKPQKDLAEWLFAQGVTHIIGSHPHVVQPLEVRIDTVTNQKHLLVYSLGNYVSNMSAPNTDGGLMVRMELKRDSISRMEKSAYSLVWTSRPPLNGKGEFSIIPISKLDSLPLNAQHKYRQFIESTRTFFEKQNRNITEYTF